VDLLYISNRIIILTIEKKNDSEKNENNNDEYKYQKYTLLGQFCEETSLFSFLLIV
jgi:hypothetical protein